LRVKKLVKMSIVIQAGLHLVVWCLLATTD